MCTLKPHDPFPEKIREFYDLGGRRLLPKQIGPESQHGRVEHTVPIVARDEFQPIFTLQDPLYPLCRHHKVSDYFYLSVGPGWL